MTEKRYTFDIDNENGFDEPYFCNGTDSFYVNNADEMELFIKEMNDLADENIQYQEWLDALREELSLADRDNTALEKENKELKKENNELKQQFILLLKKLGKKNVQCSFCEHGEHYTELSDGYHEHRFICHKKGQEYTQRSFCEDWKIKVKE